MKIKKAVHRKIHQLILDKMNKRKEERRKRIKLHKEWRLKALERDGHKCVICGDKKRVNVHHLVSKSVVSLRYDVKNALCLCSLHHIFDRKISAHKGSLMFIVWLKKHRPKQFNYLKGRLS